MLLCQGPITGVGRAWKDAGEEVSYTSMAFTLFLGAVPQTPWGYLTTSHPDHADGYPGGAYLAKANYDLGNSNTLPNHSFEIQGLFFNTAVGATLPDADPALWVQGYLTDADWGALFPAAMLDTDWLLSSAAAPTTGDGAFQTYCQAMGFGISPAISDQRPAADDMARWCAELNAAPSWTGYSLQLIPYGDQEITANGVTYVPPTAVAFNLTDDDYYCEAGDDPVRMTRSDPKDAFNIVKMVIRDRANAYNELPVPWQDDNSVARLGRREAEPYDAPDVCDAGMASVMAALYGNRTVYIRNHFEFALPPGKFNRVLPGTVLTVTTHKGKLQLVAKQVRVISVDEREDDNLDIVAEEFTGAVGSPGATTGTSATPVVVNSLVDPGDINQPVILEPPSTLTGDGAQLWGAFSGGPNWGGGFVYVSRDNVSYQAIGEVTSAARHGLTTTSLASYGGANPDTGHTVAVDLTESQGQLQTVSSADAAAGDTLSAVCNSTYGAVEYFAYRDATVGAPYNYTLGGQLYRGLYGTTAATHASGVLFARLDENIFKFDLPADLVGVPLWVKVTSYNLWGNSVQDLSTVTAYPFTPAGTGFGGGTGGVPTAPTGVSATPAGASGAVSWTANPASDNVTAYKVFRANGLAASFGSAALLVTTAGQSWTDATAQALTPYTYFVER
jgi:hypothetical protein